jgi:hypothetical protein
MKKLQELHVSMLPNGYDVKIGKKSMLYFNEQELLEGLFVHIGLKIDDYMNKQTIHDLMTACATYPDGAKALEEIARLEGVIKELREKINTLQNNTRWHNEQIKHKEEVNVKLRQELKQMKREHPKRVRARENTLANVCQTMKRKGGRDKADAAIIAQMEEAARNMGQIK